MNSTPARPTWKPLDSTILAAIEETFHQVFPTKAYDDLANKISAYWNEKLQWVWDGKPAILQSRAVDNTGYVQPKINQLRAVRGTRSIYHNNAIQSWKVSENGEVSNVQVY